MNDVWWYSIAVFVVVLISGSILNLLRRHFIFQLSGIAFFFTYFIFKSLGIARSYGDISLKELYFTFMPAFTGISACLISMVLGFWVFPPIRRKFKG